MTFSARRIQSPQAGLCSMHPFVDLLEERNFFCATVHDGVLSVDAVGTGAAVAAEATDPTYADPSVELHPVRPDATIRAAVLSLLEPARVELNTADGELAFSVNTIGDGDDILFGNLLHDRRDRAAPALPAPAAAEIGGDDADATFRDGRPFTGAMRPFLTAVSHGKPGLFAA